MANRAQAQYLRIFDEVATYARFQSYYIGQAVTWESASWSYHPFAANGMIGGTPGLMLAYQLIYQQQPQQ